MNDDYSLNEVSSGESADLPLPDGSPTNTSITNEVEEAPSFYQQMQNEIQVLRNKVDRQLSDMVLSSTLELKTLTDQMKIMKENDTPVATQQSTPSRHPGHPSSPGSLRDLASPRNRCQHSVSHMSQANAFSVTSSASSRFREDFSRDITEPTTNLTRNNRKSQFEARSSMSTTSSQLNEVVSHDVTEPTTNLTRLANQRRRQTNALQVQTTETKTTSSMSGSESSPVCKEIVISSRPKPSALQRLASSPTEQQGVAGANDRLGQINEVEDEDESFTEQNEPNEYQEIHEVSRKQHKSSRRRSAEQSTEPPSRTIPSATRRGAAYEKYRTLNKETLLRPWRQKKNDKRGARKEGGYDGNEHLPFRKSEHHLPLVQMVSSDDLSTPYPEDGLDPTRAMSPIYDKAGGSMQYTLPPNNSPGQLRNRALSPSERVYHEQEIEQEKGRDTHWNIFSMGKRKVDPSIHDRSAKKEQTDGETSNKLKNERLASATTQQKPESPSVIKSVAPQQLVVYEKSPRQSPVGQKIYPWQTTVREKTSPLQTMLCGTASPRQYFDFEQETVSPRQTAANRYKSPRRMNDPPDTNTYDQVPQRQNDPPPSSVERTGKLLPANNEKLLRAALATSDECAITIYPPTGVYHDAIVLKTYNAEEKKDEEESSALVVRANGERRARLEQVETKTVQDPYGDFGVFTGLLLKGLPFGQGTMAYADGRTYVGEWRSGRWHGQGKTTFSNGDVYVGEYYMDKRHGFGRYEWSDGRIYDGEFKNDQREGKGTYSFPDSSVYSGDFHKGLRHGQGCYKFADSSLYNGGFKNGKYDGIGECIWADGRCYRGEWKDGWAHGYGVEMRADGSIRHDGEWKRDKPIRKSKDDSRRGSRTERRRDSLQKTRTEADRYTVVYMKEQVSLQSMSSSEV